MNATTVTDTARRAELRIGCAVTCVDGAAGRLERVVFSPRQGLVTHLVVRRGSFGQSARVIPIAHARRISDERIELDLTCAALEQFPTYDPQRFTTPAADWQAAHGYKAEEAIVSLGGTNAELQARPTERSGVLQPRTAEDTAVAIVAEGMEVVCRDGKVGRVALVLLDQQTRHATHIVVRQGWLARRDIIVPLDWAIEVTHDRIVLDARDWQLEQLPEYRPDEEIAEDVRQVLYEAPVFHDGADFYAMQVRVQDGVVTLRGNVRNSARRIDAELLARRIRGVLEVRNELISDDELEIEVERALRRDDRIVIQDAHIQAVLGLVALRGRVATAQQRDLAAQIARHVPGVQAVNNLLEIDSALEPLPSEPSVSQAATARE